ncbi:MAG: hypothetical protein ACT4PV_08010 [Planctomycetaceae bacterium]
MRARRIRLASLFCLLATPLVGEEERASAQEGFETLRGSFLRQRSRRTLSLLLPGVVAPTDNDPWVHVDVNVLRQTLAEEISLAVVRDVRERAGEAVLRFSLPGDSLEKEILLSRTARGWVVTSGRAFTVNGPSLARARGPHPARIRLEARAAPDAYGGSGYSFILVTGSPGDSGNRIDLWACANGELHATGNNRIAPLGEGSLARVRGLPLDPAWQETSAVEAGRLYLVHVRTRADFYVLLQVTGALPGLVEADWTLLTDGWNAPRSIHELQRLPMAVPPDPCAAHCPARN